MNDSTLRSPVNGTFELTGRCNLSCRMCLVRVDQKRIQDLQLRERTAQEWIDMARQAAQAGTLTLLLTGGEVMLRPDFCEIYAAIANMGFILTVYTNATLVTDQVMELFRAYPPHKIGVTMYGASNQTYQRLCGCPDGYDRFVAGLDRLATLPSLLEMRTTIVQDNWTDLEAMQQFTKERLGPNRSLQISRFVTKGIRGSVTCAQQCRLSPEENVQLVHSGLVQLRQDMVSGAFTLPQQKEKFQIHRDDTISSEESLFYRCEAGRHQYAISWDGSMYACELMPEGCTQPFDMGFQRAWEELPNCYPPNQEISRCAACPHAPFCEVCPAIRRAETGDFFGIPDYFCQEAQYMHHILSDLDVV